MGQESTINILAAAGVSQTRQADQGDEQEVWPDREREMSQMWDEIVAYFMAVLFGSLRIAIFFAAWILLLMAVPTIIRLL